MPPRVPMSHDGDWSLVVGRGGYKYFPSCYVLLECNLTGLVRCSDVLSTLVRLGYVLSGYVLLECNLTGLVSCSDILGILVRLRSFYLKC